MKALVKKHKVQVSLNGEDAAALAKLARIEQGRRRETVGEATLLREIAMPIVRERVAEAEKAAA